MDKELNRWPSFILPRKQAEALKPDVTKQAEREPADPDNKTRSFTRAALDRLLGYPQAVDLKKLKPKHVAAERGRDPKTCLGTRDFCVLRKA